MQQLQLAARPATCLTSCGVLEPVAERAMLRLAKEENSIGRIWRR